MHTAWDLDAAVAAIARALRAQPATAALLSFDDGGVTGHPNHAAAAAAVARVAAAGTAAAAAGSAPSPALACWRLRSLPWYLAWLGPAALVALPALERRRAGWQRQRRRAILASPAGPVAVLRGLAAHASQRTWWRVLGAYLRSASYVSVLKAV